MKESGYLVEKGQGGFLNPPTHPEHTRSIWCGPRNNPTSCTSLSYAAAATYLDDATRALAKDALMAWNRPAIESPEVQEWILQVLGYFRGCYKGPGAEPECWHAGNLTIKAPNQADPVAQADLHAGVHLIREFYPAFVPTYEQFARAYWGTKPQPKKEE